MSQKVKTAITPTRAENYAEWYQQVVRAADLAEHSPIRGCMVIKPWGYAIWENIQKALDGMFKATGHQNVYFPLFIPLSYLEKEAQHVEGFAKECAVVTHHRLEANKEGKLVPASALDEPLIVRPTSETIFGEMAAQWIQSYRDLPLLLNQWCNVVRWEMRTRLFLRTTEFLWQEGHTVHATQEEAMEETRRMLDVYEKFARTYLAIPFIKGEKTESERFPGAVSTFTVEGMMQDRKALQGGTSHFLGQNFAKAHKIRFRDADGEEKFGWTTSWGSTTRLVGAMVMIHSDDDGLVLPPRIASTHVVIIPVLHKEESRGKVLDYCRALANALREITYHDKPLGVIVDERELTGGEKLWSWVKKGVPIRLEIGPRDIENDAVMACMRNQGTKKSSIAREALLKEITILLDDIQIDLYEKALEFRNSHTKKIDSKEEFYAFFTPKDKEQPEIHGGFALSHWSGEKEVEELVKKDFGVTIRCIPLDGEEEEGHCVITNKKSKRRVIFAKSY
ncbi:MAG TPA: proline--tRNA ligase [Rhabdochlamydiaceae bacterium]|nr:proline--tRNA ligase [Rhabdochlamydiaceae bacterium]